MAPILPAKKASIAFLLTGSSFSLKFTVLFPPNMVRYILLGQNAKNKSQHTLIASQSVRRFICHSKTTPNGISRKFSLRSCAPSSPSCFSRHSSGWDLPYCAYCLDFSVVTLPSLFSNPQSNSGSHLLFLQKEQVFILRACWQNRILLTFPVRQPLCRNRMFRYHQWNIPKRRHLCLMREL